MPINKSDIVDAVAYGFHIPKRFARLYVNKVFEVMADALAEGEDVKIQDFGTLAVTIRKAHKGFHPSRGVSMEVRECKAVAFRLGKEMRIRLNGEIESLD